MKQSEYLNILGVVGFSFLLLTLTFSGIARSQTEGVGSIHLGDPDIEPVGFGGGEVALPSDQRTSEQEQAIREKIDQNITMLTANNLLAPASTQAVTLGWPLASANGLADYGYHAVSGFVDQDPRYPNFLLDYNCGDRTYDTSSGYNHKGTDYFTWPFPQIKMNNDQVVVVAAAPGTIIYKQDGNYDKNCSFNSDTWNAVFIIHSDGSVAWYGHLKNGSVTNKGIGDTVTLGEYLGVIGSSGNSTGPHLHFELYDDGQLTDPYAGSCNQLSASSWWADQRPYYDSAVNKLMTGDAPVSFQDCPDPDIPNEQEEFAPGDEVFFTTFYRDQLSSQTSQYTIYRPDNSVFQSWSHNSYASHFTASYWWWSFDLEATAPAGQWRFEVVFNGITYETIFSVAKDLSILSPAGGEFWPPSSDHEINWQDNLTDTIQIDLYNKGVFSRTITQTTANGGPYLWSIPADTAVALGYQLRFTDLAEPSFFLNSPYFAIGARDDFYATYLPVILRK